MSCNEFAFQMQHDPPQTHLFSYKPIAGHEWQWLTAILQDVLGQYLDQFLVAHLLPSGNLT